VLREFLPAHAGNNASASLEADAVQELQRKLVDTWVASITSDLREHPLTEVELENLEKEDGPESRISVEQTPQLAYGATLLIAAATDSLLLYLQLGDGEILSVDATGETTRPLPPDERLMGNQTTSLCQPDAWKEFRAAWVADLGLPALVLLTTDGYANSFRSDEDFLKIGQDYLGILRDQGIAILAEELPEILTEATQQGSGDDITLALLQGELRPGAAKAGVAPVKPKLSAASKSALIEQLKARHSSQKRRLDEFSSRLEQTHKANRRLQALVALLILAAVGAGAFFFRDRIFPHAPDVNPATKPSGTGTDGKQPGASPDVKPSAKKPAKPVVTKWFLTFNDGGKLTLEKGMNIKQSDVFREGGDKHYASVAEQDHKIWLINYSDDTWTYKHGVGLKKSETYKKYGQIELGSDPAEIVFANGVTAKLSPAPETSSAPPSAPSSSPSSAPSPSLTPSPASPTGPPSAPPPISEPPKGLNL